MQKLKEIKQNKHFKLEQDSYYKNKTNLIYLHCNKDLYNDFKQGRTIFELYDCDFDEKEKIKIAHYKTGILITDYNKVRRDISYERGEENPYFQEIESVKSYELVEYKFFNNKGENIFSFIDDLANKDISHKVTVTDEGIYLKFKDSYETCYCLYDYSGSKVFDLKYNQSGQATHSIIKLIDKQLNKNTTENLKSTSILKEQQG